MNLRILYPKPIGEPMVGIPHEDFMANRYEPAVYDGTVPLVYPIIFDMSVNPPEVRNQYSNVNYKFFAGLLPDTFVDSEGSLRSSTGEVIFWGRLSVRPEPPNGDSPWYAPAVSIDARGNATFPGHLSLSPTSINYETQP